MTRLFSLVLASTLLVACRADAPVFRAIDCAPGEGHPAGGQIVFIQGEGFDPKAPATVLFGATPAPRVHVITNGKLQAEIPPGAPGLALTIQVQQRGRVATVPGTFRYFSQQELHAHDADGGH